MNFLHIRAFIMVIISTILRSRSWHLLVVHSHHVGALIWNTLIVVGCHMKIGLMKSGLG